MCTYTVYTCSSQYRDAGRAKEIKKKKERGSSEFRVPFFSHGLDPMPTDVSWLSLVLSISIAISLKTVTYTMLYAGPKVCGRSPAEIVSSNPTWGMDVCCECCVLSGRGLCDELTTRRKESYRLWCVVVCDLETSRMRRPLPNGGCRVTGQKKIQHCIQRHVDYRSVFLLQ